MTRIDSAKKNTFQLSIIPIDYASGVVVHKSNITPHRIRTLSLLTNPYIVFACANRRIANTSQSTCAPNKHMSEASHSFINHAKIQLYER